MDLSPTVHAALMLRFNAVFPGESYPGWEKLGLTKQSIWRAVDSEAAAIAAGKVTAEQEAALIVDGLSPDRPEQPDPQVEYQRQLDEYVAAMNKQTAERAAAREERQRAFARYQDNQIGAHS